MVTGMNAGLARNFFGIQNVVHENGAASLTQAITAVTLQATLSGIGPRAGL